MSKRSVKMALLTTMVMPALALASCINDWMTDLLIANLFD